METILGIDLGTTNSAVAIIRDGQVAVLKDDDGQAILPSVVGLDASGNLLVGHPARNQWILAPDRTIRSIKRKMGQEVTVRLGDREYRPQEISAIILRTLKDRAVARLGHEVRKAVITVPAFFNETQREATRLAGELAGLEVVRIINEPTAASLTYECRTDSLERLLVYDLGGGTFDVSIVQVEKGVVEVLASHGDTQLGGDDFDQLLLDYVCDKFAAEQKVDLRESLAAKARVLRAVEEAKIKLSYEPFARIQEEFIAEKKGIPLHLNLEISRMEYEELIDHLLTKTLVCVDESLSDARLHINQIDKVILVGGSSRTPRVHRLLQEQLKQQVHFEVDPDLCVALGAAIQGGLISGVDVGPILVDITPHTLGIETLGELHGFLSPHHFSPIIERNTPLPASRTEIYRTYIDYQDAADIRVFQGENEDARQNHFVGEFQLEGLAEVARGNQILVRFDLDLDGILTVTAIEKATGLEKRLTIENAITRARRSGAADLAADSDGRAGAMIIREDATDDLPPELRPIVAAAQQLISKADDAARQASPEDAAEIANLVSQLKGAIGQRQVAAIQAVAAQLEDLVFYLQDA
jgi:molecular chaperone DnaK